MINQFRKARRYQQATPLFGVRLKSASVVGKPGVPVAKPKTVSWSETISGYFR
jgi:hypothetical protein